MVGGIKETLSWGGPYTASQEGVLYPVDWERPKKDAVQGSCSNRMSKAGNSLERGERKARLAGVGQADQMLVFARALSFGKRRNKSATCFSSSWKDAISVVLKTLSINANVLSYLFCFGTGPHASQAKLRLTV